MKAKNTSQFEGAIGVTRKDKHQEILEIYSIDHDGIDEDGSVLTYKVVPLRQAQDVLRVALAKQRQELKEQVMEAVESYLEYHAKDTKPWNTYTGTTLKQIIEEIMENIEAIFEKGGEK